MSNLDLSLNSDLKRFLKFCDKQGYKCKVVVEDDKSSWGVMGPLEDSKAREYLDKEIEQKSRPNPLKPVPELPINYAGLYQDQLKMCTFATRLVTMNATGNLGEGNNIF